MGLFSWIWYTLKNDFMNFFPFQINLIFQYGGKVLKTDKFGQPWYKFPQFHFQGFCTVCHFMILIKLKIIQK